jgi:crotonobetainyl-CoA:carnitine CoA-transferase CaiB-like acyl-CoA transferase
VTEAGQGPLAGVTVLEVAEWVMVPAAGALLADWGARVIKVEHPTRGDAVRGLNADNKPSVRYRHFVHNANRGKESIGIDLNRTDGRELMLRIAEQSDVFLTHLLPETRKRLRIDVKDVRDRNPRLIYARGSGVGPRGAEANSRGYDFAQFWARAGVGLTFHNPSLEYPLASNAQFGDLISATVLAGGIAAAIVQRDRSGVPPVVDVSLLSVGAWTVCQDIITAAAGEMSVPLAATDRHKMPNPLTNVFRTADGRFLSFVLLQSDRYWAEFCARIGAPELIADPRYCDARARGSNREALIGKLDAIFASHSLAEWRARLSGSTFAWAVYQTPAEVAEDPQMVANDYILPVLDGAGSTAPSHLIATPVQFDERSPIPRRAPEHAEQTDTILLEVGYDWDQISALRADAVVT